MKTDPEKPAFKVLIVGGSVAGLTLANALSRANVDFLVLESHSHVDDSIGGAITIISNGLTILDQMGMYDDILELLEPAEELYTWLPNGKMLIKMDTAKVLRARLACTPEPSPNTYDHLPEKHKVLFDKKVLVVDHSTEVVVAHCSDGTSYKCNIIAGADGIHSTVRSEMWRHMEICLAGDILKKDKVAMTADYSCILGISSATEGLKLGEVHRTWCEGFSTFLNVGKGGQLFWFIFIKMDRQYRHGRIPKLTKKDLDSDLCAYLGVRIAPGVTFASVYQNATTCSYVPLEEVNYECWTWGRFACLGDAVHKVIPPSLSTTF
ncbi:Monooxygenase FAD-binding [Penicillium sp. IBT 35674x]|nr:Monooxygenase FAD-binding [Penicillium sp. IBT 35674x]